MVAVWLPTPRRAHSVGCGVEMSPIEGGGLLALYNHRGRDLSPLARKSSRAGRKEHRICGGNWGAAEMPPRPFELVIGPPARPGALPGPVGTGTNLPGLARFTKAMHDCDSHPPAAAAWALSSAFSQTVLARSTTCFRCPHSLSRISLASLLVK